VAQLPIQSGTDSGRHFENYWAVSPAAHIMKIDLRRVFVPELNRCRSRCICRSIAQRLAGVLLVQFVDDAFVGEADELGEQRVRPTVRHRRDLNPPAWNWPSRSRRY
jgi:hypothetical protein